MKINLSPPKNQMVQAWLLAALIFSVQNGVGIAGFQRIIFMESKQDAWISIFMAALGIHVLIFMMFSILKQYESADLYSINGDLFGKYIGSLINMTYVIYHLLAFSVILVDYILIVKTWIFPEMPEWLLGALLLFLTYYGVTGGVRVLFGASFLVIFITAWMIFMLFQPLSYADWRMLSPVLSASPAELLRGAYRMTLTMLGYEVIMFVYPYLKDKKKAQKFAHLGLFFTTILVLVLMIVAIVYFSPKQLEKTVWATLTMLKIVRIPNLERFEFIAISLWMVIILPNLLFYMWAAFQGLKRTFRMKDKWSIIVTSIFVMSLVFTLNTVDKTIKFTDRFSTFAFIATVIFIVFIYGWTLIKKMIVKKGKSI